LTITKLNIYAISVIRTATDVLS